MNIALMPSHLRTEKRDAADTLPLVVDLDGTLIKSDLLHESFFDAMGRHGHRVLNKELILDFSKHALKSRLAGLSQIDYAVLPYNEGVLSLIAEARSEGRAVYLATASNRIHADAVAAHLGVFDGVFASDDTTNLRGKHKAKLLVETFGENGFDYVGNDASDLEVWNMAARAFSVGLDRKSTAKLDRLKPDNIALDSTGFDYRALLKAMRPHQYAKNALIFVPLLTAHQFTWTALGLAFMAMIAFSLCASSVYIVNDLLDVQSDRSHPSKKRRPFAAGRLRASTGMMAAAILTILSFTLAWLVAPLFGGVLLVYLLLTTAYSFSLKRKMFIDVVVLAMLYSLRVIAGAVAINVAVSEWLLAFSLFIFTALALVKRYTELATRLDEGLDDPTNRNYKKSDLPVIAGLAAAAGMNSITVIALYIASAEVRMTYSNPVILWALCPVFLFWIARIIMLAHRRIVDEDPITFALRDPRSWAVGVASVVVVMAAL
jgi:4-hydroxybenzoate polyprenyltransferase/phosphoserine phosphatase